MARKGQDPLVQSWATRSLPGNSAFAAELGPPLARSASGTRLGGGQRRPASAGATRRPINGKRGGANGAAACPLLDEELHQPPLAPVPLELATPLERQFAAVLGLPDGHPALHLPPEVQACTKGPHCCWRWLARAAIEQVAQRPTTHLRLSEAVNDIQDEIRRLRISKLEVSDDDKVVWKAKALSHQKEVEELKKDLEAHREKLRQLLDVKDELTRLKRASLELEEKNRRHQSNERGLEKTVECLHLQQRALVDGDLATARQKVADLERMLEEQQKENRQLVSRVTWQEGQLQSQLLQINKLRHALESAFNVPSHKPKNAAASTQPQSKMGQRVPLRTRKQRSHSVNAWRPKHGVPESVLAYLQQG